MFCKTVFGKACINFEINIYNKRKHKRMYAPAWSSGCAETRYTNACALGTRTRFFCASSDKSSVECGECLLRKRCALGTCMRLRFAASRNLCCARRRRQSRARCSCGATTFRSGGGTGTGWRRLGCGRAGGGAGAVDVENKQCRRVWCKRVRSQACRPSTAWRWCRK